MENKEFKIIFSGKTTRDLLKMGFQIVDIKAMRDNPERTVFVFKNTDELRQALTELN